MSSGQMVDSNRLYQIKQRIREAKPAIDAFKFRANYNQMFRTLSVSKDAFNKGCRFGASLLTSIAKNLSEGLLNGTVDELSSAQKQRLEKGEIPPKLVELIADSLKEVEIERVGSTKITLYFPNDIRMRFDITAAIGANRNVLSAIEHEKVINAFSALTQELEQYRESGVKIEVNNPQRAR